MCPATGVGVVDATAFPARAGGRANEESEGGADLAADTGPAGFYEKSNKAAGVRSDDPATGDSDAAAPGVVMSGGSTTADDITSARTIPTADTAVRFLFDPTGARCAEATDGSGAVDVPAERAQAFAVTLTPVEGMQR